MIIAKIKKTDVFAERVISVMTTKFSAKSVLTDVIVALQSQQTALNAKEIYNL
jgi:hypothetical protein